MERLDPLLFSWGRWRRGCPLDVLGLECRSDALLSRRGRAILRGKALGWCPGDQLVCRPKPGTVAVMFWIGDGHWWFHMMLDEFRAVWPEIPC